MHSTRRRGRRRAEAPRRDDPEAAVVTLKRKIEAPTGTTVTGGGATTTSAYGYDNFRSGGGLLPDERTQNDQHVEPRVVKWYENAGNLKPGYTLVITVNKEGAPSCGSCTPYLEKVAGRLGVRILYVEPNKAPGPFGEANSSLATEGEHRAAPGSDQNEAAAAHSRRPSGR